MALPAASRWARCRGPWLTQWRPLLGSAPNCAGHNRWSKVRHGKGQRDRERGQLIQRLALRLRAAVQHGGPDPALNAELAQVVAQCRAHNVPKASIAAAIGAAEKASGPERRVLSVRGPGGCSLLVVTQTHGGDAERARHDVRQILQRHGAALCEGRLGAFEEQGVIRAAPHGAQGCPIAMEAALDAAIAAGAEDVCRDPGHGDNEDQAALKFLCQPSSLGAVGQQLEREGLRLLSSAVHYVPRHRVTLRADARQQAERLLRDLGDCPDVVDLFHNIEDP